MGPTTKLPPNLNYLMAPSTSTTTMANTTTTTFQVPTALQSTGGESHPLGMMDTPPMQDYNDMLSNLLSTALPPSDELFDDDMSAGNISDFDQVLGGGAPLQVADDGGMLLPP